MSLAAQIELPFREEANGAIRVGDSRVLLELVVQAFQDGSTPEVIVQRYPTLSLADVYAAIAHYLKNRDEVESYLTQRGAAADESRTRWELLQPDLKDIRARISAMSAK